MRQYPGQMRWPIPPGAIVVGGQWGSEGKGSFIYEVAQDYGLHVRVGGPQAGHSVKLPSGEVLKLQTIPVGATRGMRCAIGMASVIDPDVLTRELGWFQRLGIPIDLTIDYRATVMIPDAKEQEFTEGLRAAIGSTGHGVGAARAARIMRRAHTVEQWAVATDFPEGVDIGDTTTMVARETREGIGKGVLVEAAQGIMLSLFSSGYYPFVTSSEATPTGAFADLGLALRYAPRFESIGVFRTFPIRVAGNSGPLPNEITWDILEAERGAAIPDSEKMTTVTQATRRVARWDAKEARRAVDENGLDWAVLTFLDYAYPEVAHKTDYDQFPPGVKRYVTEREKDLGIPIRVVGTGFGTYAWRM